MFRHLVEREGYRSVAIESDCLAALAVDAYVEQHNYQLGGKNRKGQTNDFQ
jgi:erythromycin esterase-like protein